MDATPGGAVDEPPVVVMGRRHIIIYIVVNSIAVFFLLPSVVTREAIGHGHVLLASLRRAQRSEST